MRIYGTENVLEAARRRVRWLFSEFAHVYVNFSGGKDSTVVYQLALEAATELNRLPLNVLFIDQEVEWQSVIDYMRTVMYDPRVRPHWLQVPIQLYNATSADEPWLYCWEPGRESEWMRPKDPIAITENVYGETTFAKLFEAFRRYHHPAEKCVSIAGVRCEESPARRLGLTSYETYGGETWGAKEDVKRGHYAFYPIYDWAVTDVWKAMHEHGWTYCKLYDYQYQYGVHVRNMRVSNLHHETAVRNLFYAQEVERDTWEKVTARLKGVAAAGQLQQHFYAPRSLPTMFADWREYRDHLVAHLVEDPAQRAKFQAMFAGMEGRYPPLVEKELHRMQVNMVVTNDTFGTKLSSFVAAHMHDALNAGKRSGKVYT